MSNASEIVLEALIERLESWSDTSFAGGYWIGDEKGEAESQRRLRAGYIYFHQALGSARGALASGDPELIEYAAVHCQALEREGLKLFKKHEESDRRRSGGKRTGEAQTAQAEARYLPYLPRYRELLAGGKSHSTAVRIIAKEMKDPSSTKTLGKWLKKIKLEGS